MTTDTFTTEGSYGVLTVDLHTGAVVAYLDHGGTPISHGEYSDIVKFDVEEAARTFGDLFIAGSTWDICDLGKWTDKGEYFDPEPSRRQWFEIYDGEHHAFWHAIAKSLKPSEVQFVEVAACVHAGGCIEPGVKASQADSWGVYLRKGTPDEHYAEWVADCIDRETATMLGDMLLVRHGLEPETIIFLVEPE